MNIRTSARVESNHPRGQVCAVESADKQYRTDVERLACRGAEKLAEFIYTLAHDENGVGAYVRAFIAGDNLAEAQKLLDAEIDEIRKGVREYDYRHRRGDVHLQRVDHVLDLVELVILPADPTAAFEFVTRVLETDGEIAEHTGDAWLQPTFDRACNLWHAAAKVVTSDKVDRVLARLAASDNYGLRGRLTNRQLDRRTPGK
jgi:hypothetical protein